MKHLGALKNLFESVCAFHTECDFGGVDFFGEVKPEVPGGMPPGSRERTANKLNSNSVSLPKRVPSLHLRLLELTKKTRGTDSPYHSPQTLRKPLIIFLSLKDYPSVFDW